jgi:hypothetical protein
MTRSVAGLIAVVPLTVSLVATGGTAHADPIPGDMVATTTTVLPPPDNTVKKHHRATICATVTVRYAAATPVGDVTITITRNVGTYDVSSTLPYAGGQVCLKTRKLHGTGGYVVAAFYTAKAGTIFADSVGVAGFDVVKPRH